jgi:hypothetical protein
LERGNEIGMMCCTVCSKKRRTRRGSEEKNTPIFFKNKIVPPKYFFFAENDRWSDPRERYFTPPFPLVDRIDMIGYRMIGYNRILEQLESPFERSFEFEG